MPTHPFRFAPDYSKPYETLDPCHLRKDPFLQDARRLLRQTAQALETAGLHTLEIYTNRGGVAVSGEVIGHFALDEANCLEVFLGASVVGRVRPDAVTIMARVSAYTTEKRGKKDRIRIGQMGTNIWLNPNVHSGQLAQKLIEVAQGRGFVKQSNVVDSQGRMIGDFAYGVDESLLKPTPPPLQQLPLFTHAGS